eukprot:TRINITY_DN7053_c0_g1_i1.p1 TRINITY_DN7053_c0_g1~~TRINITY_DN7053_c0_g1_i1.p1  ORF type:complete len:314 (+),score=74.12 TRINITY_DN7053_c0_g1_i1:64-1005(+)
MAVADVIAPPPHLAAPAPCVAASDDAAMAASDAAEANSPEKKRKTDGAELEVSTAAAAAAAPSAAAQEVPQEASGAAVEAVRQPQESEVVEWSPAPGLEDFAGFRFTGSLRPFPRTPKMKPPEGASLPDYATHSRGVSLSEMRVRRKNIPVLEGDELEAMRHVCRLGREVLDIAGEAVKVGVTGEEIDKIVWKACAERRLYPSPLGYNGFPKSVCVSPNEVICHGIPDERPFEEGDIVNLDVSVFYDGFHSDLNETFFVGSCDEDTHTLVRASYEALQACSNMIKPGTLYRELGGVIEDTSIPFWSQRPAAKF